MLVLDRVAFVRVKRSTGDVLSGELALFARGFRRVVLVGGTTSGEGSFDLLVDLVVLWGRTVGSDALPASFVRVDARVAVFGFVAIEVRDPGLLEPEWKLESQRRARRGDLSQRNDM